MVNCRAWPIILAACAAACGSTLDLGGGGTPPQPDTWATSVDGAVARSLYEGARVETIDVDDKRLAALLARTVPGPPPEGCNGCDDHVEQSIVSCRLDACAATATTLAPVLKVPAHHGAVVLSSDEVFWTTRPDPLVASILWSCPVDECPAGPRRICDVEGSYDASFTANATHVYWVAHGEKIWRCSRAGGAPAEEVHRAVPPVVTSFAGPSEVVLSDEDMFVIYSGIDASVWRLPRDGGDDVLVYQGFPTGGMAVESDNLYVLTDVLTGQVLDCPRSGCGESPAVVASAGRWPLNLRMDDRDVYWAAEGNVWSCSRGGCSERRLVVKDLGDGEVVTMGVHSRYFMNSHYIFWLESQRVGAAALGKIKVVAK